MSLLSTLDGIDLSELILDKKKFDEFVYTPLPEAVVEIRKRWTDKELQKKMNEYFNKVIPKPFIDKFRAVLFRQLFTPNYELHHFMEITESVNIAPLFLEYLDDLFTSRNILKYSLGKLRFHKQTGVSFKRNEKQTANIIDFNESGGKKIREVKTLWNKPLVDFHHELLFSVFPNSQQYLFDASEWFHSLGDRASDYYHNYTALFIRNGILFENFVLEGSELKFIREVFLPSFVDIWKKIGKKPIIVSLLPIDTQNSSYWTSYPYENSHSIIK